MPMSRGMASGQSGSNRPRAASGAVHSGVAVLPKASGSVVGQDRRRRQEHDPEVLRQVARVLDGPVGVVAEGLVARAPRAGTGIRSRGGGRARSCEVVGEQQRRPGSRRRGRPNRPRSHVPPPPTSMKNGAPKTTVSRAVQAIPNSRPARNWRRSISASGRAGGASPAARSRPARRAVRRPRRPARRIGAERDADREQEERDRARRGRRTRSCRAGPRTRRRSRSRRRPSSRARIRRGPRAAPSAHQASPTSTAPSDRDGPDVGREAPDRDERQEHDRRQRREREQRPRRRRQLEREGVDVLHPVVAVGEAPVPRPASRSPPGRRGRPAPARRSGCRSGRCRGAR